MALFGRDDKDGGDDREGRDVPLHPTTPSGARADSPPSRPGAKQRRSAPPTQETNMANVGKSITIKGDLSGDEDLVVEGKVEGKVDLPQNQLTVGASGICEATVHAKNVVVVGRVAGDVSAIERVEVQSTGVVEGDVKAPRLVVEEGAVLNGSISMSKADGAQISPRPSTEKSKAPAPSPSAGIGATP